MTRARSGQPGQPDRPDDLSTLLEEHAGGRGWTVVPTERGEMGASFLATRGGRRLFLKRPADVRAAARLGVRGVTPPIVATGVWAGQPFLLQEWVDGRHPDRAWLRTHAPDIARLMRTYHADVPLRDALIATCPTTFAALLARELRGIERGLAAAAAPEFREPGMGAAIGRFLDRARALPPGPIVPTHGDPNPSNLLLADARIYLLDWDAVALSHPLRDLALFLWWFLPPAEWPAFLAAYDAGQAGQAGQAEQAGEHAVDVATVEWWAARGSLRVALWLDAHGRDAGMLRSFLADFAAAEAGVANPKLVVDG